jgi:hypothetical protein
MGLWADKRSATFSLMDAGLGVVFGLIDRVLVLLESVLQGRDLLHQILSRLPLLSQELIPRGFQLLTDAGAASLVRAG